MQNNQHPTSTMCMLKLKDVINKCQISRSTIYDKLDQKSKRYDPDFPKPRKLGMNSVAWVENEVEQWLKNLPYH
ncbi:AlpA family phage regulatory protein [Acinetobacter radioresistens]|uniref:AlpA family phage regulatory protein n=2 Tax=Acinetobacter radioresistens TaxID=40216 RepID=A0A8H2K6W5_ACIRA|nr:MULTISPECIES: AlpA family phage regulatory protein [Acinetobacter]EEY88009.1 DNA-binding transcriptional activator [Acinetobacter radioresistens SH164]MBA5697953.1 AlpA family phage regulatory protein [Acinetobacter radioresistens]MCK4076420.1 AlpA family phage regulatory protein [Acinetobacter radioresistens]MCK4079595.1 AlpA family phage regulatory protein [Acinetobacter radioresistens]MCK4082866.1 AlpA family phage regulatory protein [Acinetobacter radioresistens]